jgi:phospholipid/cholesterol/gamma-HCH transport system substrate-binding protein
MVYDRIDGLQEGNSILLNGTPVGIVKKLSLLFNRNNKVLVKMEVQKEVKVNKETLGTMQSASLLGGKVIELTLGNGTTLLNDGDTIKSQTSVDLTDQIKAEAKPLLNTAETSLRQITETLKRLNSTLEKADVALSSFAITSDGVTHLMADNELNITTTTANIAKLTSDFSKTQKEIASLVQKMNQLGDTLNHAQISKVVSRAAEATDNLNKTLSYINQGKGTLGKLAKNDSLYKNLNASTASLDALLKDFKANPKRYVHFSLFGGKQK